MRIRDCISDVCSSDLAPWARTPARYCWKSPICTLTPRRRRPLLRGYAHSLNHSMGEAFKTDARQRAAYRSVDRGPVRPNPASCFKPAIMPALIDARRHRNRSVDRLDDIGKADAVRSEEHTSELPSLMRLAYAAFCLKTQ